MQIIPDGPYIPNELLDLHEKGRVVFFCGSGISYDAKLPLFKGLVDNIYKVLGELKSSSEQIAYKSNQFDTCLHLLENRIVAGRKNLFDATYSSLINPSLDNPKATSIHQSLIKLSKTQDGNIHLVTTNFDRIFECVKDKKYHSFQSYSAPLLPIPDDQWDGLIYLHGLLPEKNAEYCYKNDNLIMTSGDFGRAYLTQRWAARFVSELFKNYTVCFIGYSLNDPILRYLTDALATEKNTQQSQYSAYIFTGYDTESDKIQSQYEWDIRGIAPIFYKVNDHDHSILQQSMEEWSSLYCDKRKFRYRIINELISKDPKDTSDKDNFTGRVLWALLEDTGQTMRYFINQTPAPSLEWYNSFCNDFEQLQQENFKKEIIKLFAIIPYPEWTELTSFLADWLILSLNQVKVIQKLMALAIEFKAPLHRQFIEKIETRINEVISHQLQNKSEELNNLIQKSPDAVPSRYMQSLLFLLIRNRLIIDDKTKNTLYASSQFTFITNNPTKSPLYSVIQKIKVYGFSEHTRQELRSVLLPKIKMPEDYNFQLNHLTFGFHYDMVSKIAVFANGASVETLEILIQEFQLALNDGLYLLSEMQQKSDDYNNLSYDYLHDLHHSPPQSVSQSNDQLCQVALLIKIITHSWLRLLEKADDVATNIAKEWFQNPYSIFKRLALFAATNNKSLQDELWVSLLLENNAQWLWQKETRREVCRLLNSQEKHLTQEWQKQLEAAILKEIDPSSFHSDPIMFVLKLEQSGVVLRNNKLVTWLNWSKLNIRDCENLLAEEYEFPTVKFLKRFVRIPIPNDCEAIATWLIAHEDQFDQVQKQNCNQENWFYHLQWTGKFRLDLMLCIQALQYLSQQEKYLPAAIQTMFSELTQNSQNIKITTEIINQLFILVQSLPISLLSSIVGDFTIRLYYYTCSHKETFLFLKIFNFIFKQSPSLKLDHTYGSYRIEKLPFSILLPASLVINLWNEENTVSLKPYFSKLINTNTPQLLPSKFFLAAHTLSFFQKDQRWTRIHIIPLFHWNRNKNAVVVWDGFLQNVVEGYPRSFPLSAKSFKQYLDDYKPLLQQLKKSLLNVASKDNYQDLQGQGHHGGYHYVQLLTLIAINNIDGYTDNELRMAFNTIPPEGLIPCVEFLKSLLSDESIEDPVGKIKIFWCKIWPKSKDKITKELISSLISFCISSSTYFLEIFVIIKDWLSPVEMNYGCFGVADDISNLLNDNDPSIILDFLSCIINQPINNKEWLQSFLNQIKEKDSQLESDQRYLKLLNFT